MLTTTDDPREIERCYQLGCNVYITKPVDHEAFIDAIRRLGFFLQIVKIPTRKDSERLSDDAAATLARACSCSTTTPRRCGSSSARSSAAGYSVLAALHRGRGARSRRGRRRGGAWCSTIDWAAPSTGLDVFQHLRERGHLAPAVLVTSFADESKIIEALRAGIRDVVPKSGDYLEYLPQAVDRVLGQIEAERKLAQSDMLAAPRRSSAGRDADARDHQRGGPAARRRARRARARPARHGRLHVDRRRAVGRLLLHRRRRARAVLDAVHDLGRAPRTLRGRGRCPAHAAGRREPGARLDRAVRGRVRRPARRGVGRVPRTAGRTSSRAQLSRGARRIA